VWAIGCIFGELILKKPLLQGKSEIHQLSLIFDLLGTPNDEIWPDFSSLPLTSKLKMKYQPIDQLKLKFEDFLSENGRDLISKMLTYDPKSRITTSEALKHKYFKEKPYPKDISMM
jgi:serine/threonine protein kinase